jgi:hypothetical protein
VIQKDILIYNAKEFNPKHNVHINYDMHKHKTIIGKKIKNKNVGISNH